MRSQPLLTLRLTTAPVQDLGVTPHGALSVFPVTGGSFDGTRLRGKVLGGGGDWVTAHADGVLSLDLRVTLETDDGALIYMTFTGIRDDVHHYFRTVPLFETASEQYAFLNRLLAIGVGTIGPEGPVHAIEEIL
jgi:hypothetical protein